MENNTTEDVLVSAAQACDDLMTTLNLVTIGQVPPSEAPVLVQLARDNNYELCINKGKVELCHSVSKRRIAVRYLRVGDNANKWMYGIFIRTTKTTKFQPTGSFQKEMEAERRKMSGKAHPKKGYDNTKISVLEV